jgi:thiamine-phosphate pyrophosphorylase
MAVPVQEAEPTINPGRKCIDGLLYGILDTGYVQPEQMAHTAEALLAGGAGVIQLRAKGYDCAGVIKLVREHLPQLAEQCKEHGVPFVINDFAEAAVELRADGLHIGQDDGSLESVRQVVGEHMLVGRSTHSIIQARAALDEGFDYIGFGPLFPTPTKQGRPGIGIEQVSQVEKEVGGKIPVFCIGGIKPQNLELVLASGARRVVIVSALLQAEDTYQATEQVLTRLRAN